MILFRLVNTRGYAEEPYSVYHLVYTRQAQRYTGTSICEAVNHAPGIAPNKLINLKAYV